MGQEARGLSNCTAIGALGWTRAAPRRGEARWCVALPVLSVAGDLASLDLFLPQREVLAQQLHDEGGVPVRLLVEGVELGGGVVEGLAG